MRQITINATPEFERDLREFMRRRHLTLEVGRHSPRAPGGHLFGRRRRV